MLCMLMCLILNPKKCKSDVFFFFFFFDASCIILGYKRDLKGYNVTWNNCSQSNKWLLEDATGYLSSVVFFPFYRAEELETAFIEMLKQDNRRSLSLKVIYALVLLWLRLFNSFQLFLLSIFSFWCFKSGILLCFLFYWLHYMFLTFFFKNINI